MPREVVIDTNVIHGGEFGRALFRAGFKPPWKSITREEPNGDGLVICRQKLRFGEGKAYRRSKILDAYRKRV
jgi:hypothetical protein